VQKTFHILAVALILATSVSTEGSAAPSAPTKGVSDAGFAVSDWLSAETASRLDLGFDVLVPGDVPSPFGNEPSVDASEGFYSLYWLIAGAPPTYLLISGEVGGSIPDFSYYDRNVQLEQNAAVRGHPAYHDLTPIYDKVYWQVGDIVYTVDSHNLDTTDSLSLANSLVTLNATGGESEEGTGRDTGSDETRTDNETGVDQEASATLGVPESVRSGDTIAVGVGGVNGALLSADAGSFAASEDSSLADIRAGSYDWIAPATDKDLTVSFTLTDSESGKTLARAQTLVLGASSSGDKTTAALSCPVLATAGRETRLTISGQGSLTLNLSDGLFPANRANLDFDAEASDSGSLTGALPEAGVISLDWLAPDFELTAYFFVYDSAGNLLAECGTVVTFDEIKPTATATPKPGTGKPGDGTELPGRFDDIVAEVLAVRRTTADETIATKTPTATNTPKPDKTATKTNKKKKTKTPTPTVKPTKTSTPKPSRTPTRTATLTPSIVPTSSFAPVTGNDGMVALDIGPAGGALECASGTNAKIEIPANALNEASMVTIRPIGKSKMPVVEGIRLLSGTGFDITVAEATGVTIDRLNAPAKLTIDLPKDAKPANYHIYRVQGSNLIPLPNVEVGEDSVSTTVTQFSRVVIGVSSQTVVTSTERDPKPFIFAALGFVTVMLVLFAVGSFMIRRRPRSVTPRRAMTKRARIR